MVEAAFPEILPSERVLYYPCSGRDTLRPFQLFRDVVDVLCFVDLGYLPGTQQRNRGGDASTCKYLLSQSTGFDAIDHSITGDPTARIEQRSDAHTGKRYLWVEPCIRTERYRERKTGRPLRVIRKRGFGMYTLRTQLPHIDVFFYRGDSLGEGGSGNRWFAPGNFEMVVSRLRDGGLLVTDGSNMVGRYPWGVLAYDAAVAPTSFRAFDRQFTWESTLLDRRDTRVWRVGW